MMISLFFCFILFSNHQVEANDHRLKSLHIHTYIHEDGSATITETREAFLYEGTENYDVIENLGNSKIIDFTVSENDRTYDFIEDWDVDATRKEKAFKNGIIETDNGYEIAWGIGEYGYHHYVLEYTVTDFIKQLKHSQILFWRFVNDETNIPPERLTIVIETDKELHADNEKVWGFGFDGDIYFNNGRVIANSHSALTSKDYATVLLKFNDGEFQTADVLPKTFEEIKEEAFIGSDYDHNEPSTVSPADQSYFDWLYVWIPFVIFSPAIIFFIIVFIIFYRSNKPRRALKKFKGEYERDIPYDGPFIDLYILLFKEMKITKFKHLIAAFLLKWMEEERIEIEQEEIGILFKKEVPLIHIKERTNDKEGLERELYDMMLQAAGDDDTLKKHEFADWIEHNRYRIRTWEKNVKEASQQTLTERHIYKEIKKRTFLFKQSTYELTSDGHDVKIHIYKFINYLRDFSLLNEHEAVNVKLWDELMIWAALLGITDEVYKEFQTLYPDYARESAYSYTSISNVTSLSNSISNSRSYVSSSSGGGGSVSGGGGGGSFGGGSGGGTR